MRLLRGGGAVSFALRLAPAVQQAVEGGRAAGPLHGGGRLQVHQVVVGLAHPGLLTLVAPPEKELGALLKEAAWRGRKPENRTAHTKVLVSLGTLAEAGRDGETPGHYYLHLNTTHTHTHLKTSNATIVSITFLDCGL